MQRLNTSQRSIPTKHFLFFKTSSRRLEDVFSVTLFVFQDVFKTYLQYVFLKSLQDVFQDVFKTSSKTSSRHVCKTFCCYVFKTSWKTKKFYTEDVFSTSSPRRMFAGFVLEIPRNLTCGNSFCKVTGSKTLIFMKHDSTGEKI